MADCIKREAAVKIAEKYGLANNSALRRHAELADCIASEIVSLPTTDVATVMHGKWTPEIEKCPVCSENKFKDLDADIWADWQPPFCPNCGAKMDGDFCSYGEQE